MEAISSSAKSKGPFITVIVISVAALVSTSIILALLHIVFTRYCKRRRSNAQTVSIVIEPTTVGLDKRILNTIPILFYSAKTCDLYRISQGHQCVICLGRLSKGDLIRWLPLCGHVFHVPCIDNWFHAHSNCPICRSPVTAQSSRYSEPVPSIAPRSTLHGLRVGGTLRNNGGEILPY
ncbi:hypothetical protein Cgig2_001244 [Carnegiea gigantea]|uniref:RING-type E3 ubiquitin transferase n=1 Tax=Carnegiea gigantea TaxID=171969 RepID=A0A9Q1JNQ0_9CARY|nr:hypothetical protein Cgig2_001244 [Carnegiea gigantea]